MRTEEFDYHLPKEMIAQEPRRQEHLAHAYAPQGDRHDDTVFQGRARVARSDVSS
jgi:S-adenosylmethionine:tRNA-ribosyltransferase-isomerase (queuine synthetase)